ncbi:MAG: PstS family phosphate ABC transporter substrate-binding protein [Chloroflexota bacterium]
MISTPRRLGALILAAAFAIGACSSGSATNPPGDSDLSGTITIDGSSTVFPITEAVAEEFQIANNDVRVPVAFSGTGGGFKKFCREETDLNDASRPIKADDAEEGLACVENGVEYVELQVAIDGLSVVVNPANEAIDCLTVYELNTIFGPDSPEVITWADVRPGLPADRIVRFIPGADSGTFDYFTEEIAGETKASTTFATQSEDDNVLVTGVSGDVNAIGYFGYAYFEENQDKVQAIAVDGGDGCVEPTPETINSNEYHPLSRPLFIYPNVGAAKERAELKAFVDFYLENTNALSAEVGYIALPDDLLAAEKAKWAATVGG